MGVQGERAVWQAESRGSELVHQTIGELLDHRAAASPDKEALVYSYREIGLDLRMTFRACLDEVNRLAKGLLALGVRRGEHVAVWATNVPEWIFLELALAKVGAVLVTVNTNYRAGELEYVLRQGDITTLFMIAAYRDHAYVETINGLLPELSRLSDPLNARLHSARLPLLERVVLIGERAPQGMLLYSQVAALAATISDAALNQRQASVAPDDVAQMLYTSGTTGFPKAVMLTHVALVNQALIVGRQAEFRADDGYVTPMPFFHVAGCVGAVLIWLASGCRLIPLISFDPAKQLALFAEQRGTVTMSVPTMLIAMLNHSRFIAGEFDLSALRLVITGAAPVPVALMEQVKQQMGADCTIVFGQTESSGSITQTVITDSFELKSSTVGIPLPHVEVKIVHPETGEPVGFNEPGELLERGFLVMQGYYNMPERTAETIDADGWLHTGDLATMNPQGYVNIVGRVKDMIIRGGENVYPAEVEAWLMRHPKVVEAQIVGVPDPLMGEEVAAFVRLKAEASADEEEIREYCRTNISRYKVPRYVRFVEQYPLTASGKVKKFELRALLIKELGLEDVARQRTA
ncbi:MAG TPA: AMP-binding protein [Blastocatellia bacterium]|nr:AMP-binding protein [Blastocatellia bacterium]